jgi:hypothetical protein
MDWCDVCGLKSSSAATAAPLLLCRSCGVRVHPNCYGLFSRHGSSSSNVAFECWACQAAAPVASKNDPTRKGPGMVKSVNRNESLTKRLPRYVNYDDGRRPVEGKSGRPLHRHRPTDCCLCGLDDGTDWFHAMHPIYHRVGNKGRPLLLEGNNASSTTTASVSSSPASSAATSTALLNKPDRVAWAHTVCCWTLYAYQRTGPCVFPCRMSGAKISMSSNSRSNGNDNDKGSGGTPSKGKRDSAPLSMSSPKSKVKLLTIDESDDNNDNDDDDDYYESTFNSSHKHTKINKSHVDEEQDYGKSNLSVASEALEAAKDDLTVHHFAYCSLKSDAWSKIQNHQDEVRCRICNLKECSDNGNFRVPIQCYKGDEHEFPKFKAHTKRKSPSRRGPLCDKKGACTAGMHVGCAMYGAREKRRTATSSTTASGSSAIDDTAKAPPSTTAATLPVPRCVFFIPPQVDARGHVAKSVGVNVFCQHHGQEWVDTARERRAAAVSSRVSSTESTAGIATGKAKDAAPVAVVVVATATAHQGPSPKIPRKPPPHKQGVASSSSIRNSNSGSVPSSSLQRHGQSETLQAVNTDAKQAADVSSVAPIGTAATGGPSQKKRKEPPSQVDRGIYGTAATATATAVATSTSATQSKSRRTLETATIGDMAAPAAAARPIQTPKAMRPEQEPHDDDGMDFGFSDTMLLQQQQDFTEERIVDEAKREILRLEDERRFLHLDDILSFTRAQWMIQWPSITHEQSLSLEFDSFWERVTTKVYTALTYSKQPTNWSFLASQEGQAKYASTWDTIEVIPMKHVGTKAGGSKEKNR